MTLALLTLLTANAAPPQVGEAWVQGISPTELDALGLTWAEGVDGDWVRVHGTREQLDAAAQRFPMRDRVADHRLRRITADQADDATLALAEDPRAALFQAGWSVEGRPIYGVMLGDPALPTVRVLGTHHGDEAVSTELALELGRLALAGEGIWAPVLEQRSVLLVPVVNPDGLAQGSRYNANGVDLNRNYDVQWAAATRSGDGPFSEPETRAVRTLSLTHDVALGLSLHAGAVNLGWPWNHGQTISPDEGLLRTLAEDYARRCTAPGFYVTNGADWYVTNGDTNDWSLGRTGVLDYTLEASQTKDPSDVAQVLGWHTDALPTLLLSHLALQGAVVDAQTGRPIQAQLSFDGRAEPLWTGQQGHFARPMPVGIYDLTVSAPGYVTVEQELRVPAGEVTWLDLALEPSALGDARPEPALVSTAGPSVALRIPGFSDAASLELQRPGVDSVSVDGHQGVFEVDPAGLVPGAWTVVVDGVVLARALLVSDGDSLVRVHQVEVGDELTLTGQGFGVGTQVWALWGADRTMVPLSVLSESPDALVLDVSSLPETGTLDVVVVSNGAQVAVADVLGDPAVDTTEVREDTGDTGACPEVVGYRQCSSGVGPGLWLLALGALLLRRENVCADRSSEPLVS